MNKSYIITFSLSVIILFSIAAVLLMIVLPDQVGILEGNAENYDSIVKSKYTFESTKNITTDITKKDYIVTSDQISNYQSNYLYIPGNSDPFSPKVTETEVGNSSEGSTSQTQYRVSYTESSTKNNTNLTSTTTTTGSSAAEAQQKTTNSNGGVANPASTNK